MKYIGAHVSASGGVCEAPRRSREIGGTAFALFTKNQRQWKAKPLSEQDTKAFKEQMQLSEYTPEQVLPHDSYLINLGNTTTPELRKKHVDSFCDEMRRVSLLGLDRLNFHPGSHLNALSEDACLKVIAEGIDIGISESSNVHAVIEITAGQGTNLGHTFEQIARIIDYVRQKSRVGVCLDTCHMFAGGYDIRTREAYESTMESFERIIGFDLLMGLHLNDAKNSLGSKVDRHASLGKGELGLDPFRFIMEDPRFDGIPCILETTDPELWPEEISLLKGYCNE